MQNNGNGKGNIPIREVKAQKKKRLLREDEKWTSTLYNTWFIKDKPIKSSWQSDKPTTLKKMFNLLEDQ